MHHRVALIKFAWKTRQIKRPVEIGFHDVFVAAEVTRLKLKIWQAELVAADVRRLKSKRKINVSLVASSATKYEFLR